MKTRTATMALLTTAAACAVLSMLPALRGATRTAVAQSPEEPARKAHAEREARERWWASLDFGKTLLKDQANLRFMEIPFADIPPRLKSLIDNVLWRVLRKDVHPCKPSQYPIKLAEGVELRVRVFVAIDDNQNGLIEYRWTHDGRPIRVVCSRNATKIDFDLECLAPCEGTRGASCVAAAREWVEDVLKLEGKYPSLKTPIEYQVSLPWPEELSEGVAFSSAAEQSIMRLYGIPRYFDRVDAFIENGALSILLYRNVGQLPGYQDGSKWFADEFRAEVLERARKLSKAPKEGEQKAQE